jgi:hypothetical protein
LFVCFSPDFVDPTDKRSTVNIGYSLGSLQSKVTSSTESKESFDKNKENKELEKLSRSGECKI